MSAPCAKPPQDRQLSNMVEELRRYAAEWADRAASLATTHDLKTIVSQILADILERIEEVPPQEDGVKASIRQYIADNLHKGLTLKHLAGFLGYSEKYCSDLFRARMGASFSKYIQGLRIVRAKRLLLIPHNSVADVAEALGFCDQFSFSHFFKKAVGCSPHHFRQKTSKHPDTCGNIRPSLARYPAGVVGLQRGS